MSVIDDAVKTANAGLDFKKLVDRFRGAYTRRRAEFLHAANTSWNASKLASQITAEMAVIKTYLDSKSGIVNNNDPAATFHLDLKIEAGLITLSVNNGAFGQRLFDVVLKELLTKRADAVAQIVWRALAIQSGQLWKSLGPPPQLQQAALDELLDRRLRMLEQMHCSVNSGGFPNTPGRPWKVSGPAGPWEDGFKGRCFEYPDASPGTAFGPFRPQMGNWYFDFAADGFTILSINYNPANGDLPIHFPDDVKNSWKVDKHDESWINYVPSAKPPSQVIQQIFTPHSDFWNRCWLFCDQVGSLVNVESLLFALLRREGNDTAFNQVMSKLVPDDHQLAQPGEKRAYARLGPLVRSTDHDLDQLMADDQDPYFENLDVDFDDLQVGDFVRFWNSRMYTMLPPYTGAWTSEFSLVMSLDVDGKNGKVLKPVSGGPQIWLAGHGVHTRLYDAMAVETTNTLVTRFAKARKLVAAATGDVVVENGQRYVRWSPYESFDPPGAWWVEIPKKRWRDRWWYGTEEEVLAGVPGTVGRETGGTGYNPPPTPEAVYFPLYEPAVAQGATDGHSWHAYLRLRKADPQFRPASNKLRELSVDGRLAQGLFYRGSKSKVPVVRPRVRP
jgi:hypothetical protein